MSKLDYIEREATRNEAYHLETLEHLNREAHTTLSFLIVAIGAAFGGTTKMIEANQLSAWGIGLGVITLYLAGVGLYLTKRCLIATDAIPPGNEPAHLLSADCELDELRVFQLQRMQEAINKNYDRNNASAAALNKTRVMICVTPLLYPLCVVTSWVVTTVI